MRASEELNALYCLPLPHRRSTRTPVAPTPPHTSTHLHMPHTPHTSTCLTCAPRRCLDSRALRVHSWLAFKQPAMGVLCWGEHLAGRCRFQFQHTATCHADHKIVAYHREALETLLPMPTHRDRDCWWASQWGSNAEINLFYRGHWLYYPGELRVRGFAGSLAPRGPSRYERHAKYPREGCGTNGTNRGAFMRITHDLLHLAARAAWPNHTARDALAVGRRCFAPLVKGCLKRFQGALDGPILPDLVGTFVEASEFSDHDGRACLFGCKREAPRPNRGEIVRELGDHKVVLLVDRGPICVVQSSKSTGFASCSECAAPSHPK